MPAILCYRPLTFLISDNDFCIGKHAGLSSLKSTKYLGFISPQKCLQDLCLLQLPNNSQSNGVYTDNRGCLNKVNTCLRSQSMYNNYYYYYAKLTRVTFSNLFSLELVFGSNRSLDNLPPARVAKFSNIVLLTYP